MRRNNVNRVANIDSVSNWQQYNEGGLPEIFSDWALHIFSRNREQMIAINTAF